MSKININSYIENINDKDKQYIKCLGDLNNNKIYFNDDNISVTISISNNKIVMVRENDEYILNLSFDKNQKTNGIYEINGVGLLNLEILTNRLDITDKKIYIEYTLNNNDTLLGKFIFSLDYEVI